jgi:hypothetical protein
MCAKYELHIIRIGEPTTMMCAVMNCLVNVQTPFKYLLYQLTVTLNSNVDPDAGHGAASSAASSRSESEINGNSRKEPESDDGPSDSGRCDSPYIHAITTSTLTCGTLPTHSEGSEDSVFQQQRTGGRIVWHRKMVHKLVCGIFFLDLIHHPLNLSLDLY